MTHTLTKFNFSISYLLMVCRFVVLNQIMRFFFFNQAMTDSLCYHNVFFLTPVLTKIFHCTSFSNFCNAYMYSCNAYISLLICIYYDNILWYRFSCHKQICFLYFVYRILFWISSGLVSCFLDGDAKSARHNCRHYL